MMKKDKRFYEQLNKPNAPGKLKEKIYQNWEEQVRVKAKKNHYIPLFATAASFLLVLMTWFSVDPTPAVVYSALSDIADEGKHGAGVSIDISHIKSEFQIKSLPHFMQVEMTKKCDLEEHQTVHMEMASLETGKVHMFLSKGELDTSIWQLSEGGGTRMPWKLIHPRPGLSVLVFYDEAAKVESVEKITKQMFYI